MNKKLLALFLFCISVFSITQSANANEINSQKQAGYISLSSSATKEVEPNVAKVTFAVENTADNAQKASNDNNEISNKIIKALKEVTSIDTDIIKTTNFTVRPVYNTTTTGKRTIKNYIAQNAVTVQTKDITKVAKLIDTAIANGANRTEGLSYSYENEKSACSDLYPSLFNNLRKQADEIATAAGTTVDGIKYINASCNTDMTVSSARYLNAKADGTSEAMSTPVEPGKVKIRVYVNADFYIK